MFPVCSQSCSHLCSHSNPFLFIRVPSVPSMSRARTYEDPRVFLALRVNIESDREHWELGTTFAQRELEKVIGQ